MIMGQNRGLLKVYADRRSHRLIGAAMVGSRSEHLAHLLSWAIQSGMTVERALEMPFYHPVIEEALQEVLIDLEQTLAKQQRFRRFNFFPRKHAESVLQQ
jgi:dihydrolipoamide dehydrogenase